MQEKIEKLLKAEFKKLLGELKKLFDYAEDSNQITQVNTQVNTKAGEQSVQINDFSDEVLLRILTAVDISDEDELKNLFLVSKKWHRLTKDIDFLWGNRKIILKIIPNSIFDTLVANSIDNFSLARFFLLFEDDRINSKIEQYYKGYKFCQHYARAILSLVCQLESKKSNFELLIHALRLNQKITQTFLDDMPLHRAAREGNAEACEWLLENILKQPEQINAKNSNKEIPLHLASNVAVVKVLLKRGAEIDSKGESELTPLIYATQSQNVAVVEKLLASGANINAVTSFGKAALHIAATKGNLEITKLLVKKGANLAAEAILTIFAAGASTITHYLTPKNVSSYILSEELILEWCESDFGPQSDRKKVSDYLENIEKKLEQLEKYKKEILEQADEIRKQDIMNNKEKFIVIKDALWCAWRKIRPLIFEEDYNVEQLKNLLFTTEGYGDISVKNALELNMPKLNVTIGKVLFDTSKTISTENIVNCNLDESNEVKPRVL